MPRKKKQLQPGRYGYPPDVKARAKLLLEGGTLSKVDVAKKAGISRFTLNKWIKAYGWKVDPVAEMAKAMDRLTDFSSEHVREEAMRVAYALIKKAGGANPPVLTASEQAALYKAGVSGAAQAGGWKTPGVAVQVNTTGSVTLALFDKKIRALVAQGKLSREDAEALLDDTESTSEP